MAATAEHSSALSGPQGRSSGLVTGSYWPQLRCGISGALCGRDALLWYPSAAATVIWTGHWQLLAATEVRHPSAAGTVIWTGHRQLLAATEVRHQWGALLLSPSAAGTVIWTCHWQHWPQLRCGISGALCFGSPRPRGRSSGLVSGSY
jgi:hypothetical protein